MSPSHPIGPSASAPKASALVPGMLRQDGPGARPGARNRRVRMGGGGAAPTTHQPELVLVDSRGEASLVCHLHPAEDGCLPLSKTKTLQTVTLRVAILSDFFARRLSQNFGAKLKQKSAQVRAVFFLEICWHRIVTCSVTVCGVLVLLNSCSHPRQAKHWTWEAGLARLPKIKGFLRAWLSNAAMRTTHCEARTRL